MYIRWNVMVIFRFKFSIETQRKCAFDDPCPVYKMEALDNDPISPHMNPSLILNHFDAADAYKRSTNPFGRSVYEGYGGITYRCRIWC